MSPYTLQQLCDDGPQYAMALLLRSLDTGEPFVTYSVIRMELEHQFNIDKIFPTQIGHVAGCLMDRILEIQPRAPLINTLITRATGIPGVGVGGYLANRYGDEKLRKWDKLSTIKKKEIVDRERKKVFRYQKWHEITDQLFGPEAAANLRVPPIEEIDPIGGRGFGGEAESEEHRLLKEYVAENPQSIGISKLYGVGETEHRLSSGDEVDVMFSKGLAFRTIEIKSRRSSEEDIRRGIYQCVKYREVKRLNTRHSKLTSSQY